MLGMKRAPIFVLILGRKFLLAEKSKPGPEAFRALSFL